MLTLILRHKKENLKKCTLANLKRKDLLFLTYPKDPLPNLNHYLLLTLNAEPLTSQDKGKGIFLIDATWRYAEKITRVLDLKIEKRSLPPFETAYPRRQTACSDPKRGLASIEALFIAYCILEKEDPLSLLDHYFWKEAFLKKNATLLQPLSLLPCEETPDNSDNKRDNRALPPQVEY